ncbi:hypothetical protein L6452_08231 [Arctium lappa]|uniref:Uncharacterized protein n=1 Tax=Arctium lappa TaxID=4217 RepID=A0ACB9DH45_ARCLA|nr:hypothetical protein L6452_08231 [Arctium lappa]
MVAEDGEEGISSRGSKPKKSEMVMMHSYWLTNFPRDLMAGAMMGRMVYTVFDFCSSSRQVSSRVSSLFIFPSPSPKYRRLQQYEVSIFNNGFYRSFSTTRRVLQVAFNNLKFPSSTMGYAGRLQQRDGFCRSLQQSEVFVFNNAMGAGRLQQSEVSVFNNRLCRLSSTTRSLNLTGGGGAITCEYQEP